MNANELADMLAKSSIRKVSQGEVVVDMFEIADMLRQQQAEIEALKNRNWELVSEPWGFDRHPAKTLTDEEITEVLNDENIAEYHQGNWLVLPYAFARAILRKAQEK